MTTSVPARGDRPPRPPHRTGRASRGAPALDVDWATAGRWGGRLARPGPTGSRAELTQVVADLHAAGDRAHRLAVRASRLGSALEAAGALDARAEVLVVDRPGWSRAAAQSFAGLVPTLAPGAPGAPGAPEAAPGWRSRLPEPPAVGTSAQVATLLGLLASRVLGQFDPFAQGAPPAGRLLLVAPNILHAERSMRVDPADFRLWVSVHEQTHALQFAAAPWLAGHLRREIAALVDELSRTPLEDELSTALAGGLRAVRARRDDALEEDWSLLDVALDEEQRARVERITAVMSLLEGHADVSMDLVGRRTIPSARRLRARFEARRRGPTGIDRLLRRLLGMDAKLAQYRRGAAFVRAVRRAGGRNALDAVWADPVALPTPREIADPSAWVRRVHG